MITLDQIKQLDTKVRKAIDKINSLKSENNILLEKLDTYQLRIEELEILIDTFKEDQGEIEHGIIDALNQLDILEDNTIVPGENSEHEETVSETIEESDVDVSDNKKETENEPSLEPEIDKEEETEETTENSGDSEIELDIF